MKHQYQKNKKKQKQAIPMSSGNPMTTKPSITNLGAIPHDLTSRARFQTRTIPIVALEYPQTPFTGVGQPRRVQDRDQWSLNLRDQMTCG